MTAVSAQREKSSKLVPSHEVTAELLMYRVPRICTPVPLQTLPEFIICDVDQHIEPVLHRRG